MHWQRQKVSDTSWLRAVAFGNGMFVTGGDNGVILASSDGVHWTQPVPGNTNYVTSAAFANGLFVVGLGSSSAVLTSTNGLTWSAQPNDAYLPFALVGNQGSFWRVSGSEIAASPDGINWLNQALPVPVNSFAFSGITVANGTFVAVGGAGAIAYSTGGTNWMAAGSGVLTPFNDVTFGQGKFVAADNRGNILVSANGNSWKTVYSWSRLGAVEFSRLLYAGGIFFASGNAGQAASLDGLHWWPDDPLGAALPTGIVYVQGKFIMAGAHGVFSSSDGLHWQAPTPGLTNGLNAIAYGNGIYVAMDNSTFWVSSDATNWVASYRTDAAHFSSLQDLAFANGLFVAVAYEGAAFASTDGTNWTAAIVPPAGQVRRLASAGGTFVAAGDNLSVSADGLHWTVARADLPALHGVAYGNQ
jgi:hypothetical protein